MKTIKLRYAVAVVLSLSYGALIAQTRPFTVKDDIEMERFNDPPPAAGEGTAALAQCSPDGKWAAVVTTRGIISPNDVRSTITLFETRLANRYLARSERSLPFPGRVVAQVTSFTHHNEPDAYAAVIKDLRWSSDSEHLYFRGEDLRGVYHLYSVKTDGSGFHSLTPSGRDVRRYELGHNVIVYKAKEVSDPNVAESADEVVTAESVDGRSIPEILFPLENSSFLAKTWKLWTIRFDGGGEHTSAVKHYMVRALESMSASSHWDPMAISPSGDRIVVLTQVSKVPPSWSAYNPSIGHDDMRYQSDDPALVSDNNQLRPREYTLIDLSTGVAAPLIKAPEGLTLGYVDRNQILWSPDGRRVLLANTFMPLTPELDHTNATEPCVVVSVEVASLKYSCLFFNAQGKKNFTGDIFTGGVHVAFGSTDDEIVVTYRDGQKGLLSRHFRYENDQWGETAPNFGNSAEQLISNHDSHGPELPGQLHFEVKQGLNDPPKLWITAAGSDVSKMLWDPNPQLAHLEFGEASVFKWKDETGREWTGGLIKPVGYVPEKKYPLVIQLYEFDPHTFLTDGSWPTAFAARHLASSGIAVLQVQKDMVFHGATDAQEHLDAYRSAVDLLAKEGVIDRSKVGLVGFSTTAWYVENALISCPKLFAAATIADGLDYSYMQYHLASERSAIQQQRDENIIGAKPIDEGLRRWIKVAPGFNLDKVLTPLRVEAMRPFSLLGEWEIYSSLKMQHKPVDLIYFPSSQHIHQRPLARLESQQGNVDWMRFWLQDYVDPDPAKAEQYKLWERLRNLQNIEDRADDHRPTAKP